MSTNLMKLTGTGFAVAAFAAAFALALPAQANGKITQGDFVDLCNDIAEALPGTSYDVGTNTLTITVPAGAKLEVENNDGGDPPV